MDDLKTRLERAKQTGEILILTEKDLALGIDPNNEKKEIKTIDDLIMVHETKYMPEGVIKTPKSGKKPEIQTQSYIIDGNEQKIEIEAVLHRNTIHFCLNSEAEKHVERNSSSGYAIIMPLSTNKEKIVAGNECDLFSEGDVEIRSDAYILCPENEVSIMKEKNPNATIVGVKGEFVDPYVNVFISRALGYKIENPENSNRNWGSKKDHDAAIGILANEGWPWEPHSLSKWRKEEIVDTLMQVLNRTIETIKNKKILYTEENIQKAFESIQTLVYNVLCNTDKGKELYPNILDRIYKEIGIDYGEEFIADPLKINSDEAEIISEKYSKRIICKLREYAILEKMNQGIASQKEEIEVLFDQQVGNFCEFEGALSPYKETNLFSKEEIEKFILKKYGSSSGVGGDLEEYEKLIKSINEIKNIENKELSSLTEEEKEIMETALDFKISLMGRGDSINFVLVDSSLHFGMSGRNQAHLVDSMGIPRTEYLDNLRIADSNGEIVEYMKSIFEKEGSHLVVKNANIIETDFDASQCKTVKEYMAAVTRYINCMNMKYSGVDINFDSQGNIIEAPSNKNTLN